MQSNSLINIHDWEVLRSNFLEDSNFHFVRGYTDNGLFIMDMVSRYDSDQRLVHTTDAGTVRLNGVGEIYDLPGLAINYCEYGLCIANALYLSVFQDTYCVDPYLIEEKYAKGLNNIEDIKSELIPISKTRCGRNDEALSAWLNSLNTV